MLLWLLLALLCRLLHLCWAVLSAFTADVERDAVTNTIYAVAVEAQLLLSPWYHQLR